MPHLLEVMNSFKCIHNSYPNPFMKQFNVSDSPLGFGSSGLGGEGGIVNSWRIKHPVVTFFHLLFRTLAIIGKSIIGKSIIGCQGWYNMKSKWLLLPKTSNLQPICYAAGSLMASLEALWQSYFSSRSTFGQSKILQGELWRDSGTEFFPSYHRVSNLASFRWWNYVNDEGESVWVFEKGGDEVDLRLSKAEVQIFWTGLVASPVIWVRINFWSIWITLVLGLVNYVLH